MFVSEREQVATEWSVLHNELGDMHAHTSQITVPLSTCKKER
jgi:hypothetical protein